MRPRRLTVFVFIIYMLLLCWLVLFKLATGLEGIPHMRSVNLVPYGGSLRGGDSYFYAEILLNVLCFVPLGVYARIFQRWRSFWRAALPCLALSLAFEAAQYAFAIGVTDVTDVIGNTLGGVLGIALYRAAKRPFPRRAELLFNLSGLGIEAAALAVTGLPLILR